MQLKKSLKYFNDFFKDYNNKNLSYVLHQYAMSPNPKFGSNCIKYEICFNYAQLMWSRDIMKQMQYNLDFVKWYWWLFLEFWQSLKHLKYGFISSTRPHNWDKVAKVTWLLRQSNTLHMHTSWHLNWTNGWKGWLVFPS